MERLAVTSHNLNTWVTLTRLDVNPLDIFLCKGAFKLGDVIKYRVIEARGDLPLIIIDAFRSGRKITRFEKHVVLRCQNLTNEQLQKFSVDVKGDNGTERLLKGVGGGSMPCRFYTIEGTTLYIHTKHFSKLSMFCQEHKTDRKVTLLAQPFHKFEKTYNDHYDVKVKVFVVTDYTKERFHGIKGYVQTLEESVVLNTSPDHKEMTSETMVKVSGVEKSVTNCLACPECDRRTFEFHEFHYKPKKEKPKWNREDFLTTTLNIDVGSYSTDVNINIPIKVDLFTKLVRCLLRLFKSCPQKYIKMEPVGNDRAECRVEVRNERRNSKQDRSTQPQAADQVLKDDEISRLAEKIDHHTVQRFGTTYLGLTFTDIDVIKEDGGNTWYKNCRIFSTWKVRAQNPTKQELKKKFLDSNLVEARLINELLR